MKHQLCDIADADIDAQKEVSPCIENIGVTPPGRTIVSCAIHLWSRSRQFVVGSFLAR